MIGFDPVIIMAVGLLPASVHYAFPQCCRITAEAISDEDMWRPVIWIRQRLFQEQLRGFPIPRLRKIEVHRLTMAIDSSEEIHPFTGMRTNVSSMCQVEDFRFT